VSADVLKSLDIPDALLSNSKKTKKDHTLTRLTDCLQTRLEEIDYQEVERAVRTLRHVNNVRVTLQHSGAARELPAQLAEPDIPCPPQWGATCQHPQVEHSCCRYVP
jgi:hypothetical protein